jgi:hypothetical protein
MQQKSNKRPGESPEEKVSRILALARQKMISPEEARREIMKGDTNAARNLRRWKKLGLWPPHIDTLDKLSKTEKNLKEPEPSIDEVISKGRALMVAKDILDNEIKVGRIEEWTGQGRKGTQNLQMLGAKLPNDLVAEIKALGGKITDHVEKALKLYLRVLKAHHE